MTDLIHHLFRKPDQPGSGSFDTKDIGNGIGGEKMQEGRSVFRQIACNADRDGTESAYLYLVMTGYFVFKRPDIVFELLSVVEKPQLLTGIGGAVGRDGDTVC